MFASMHSLQAKSNTSTNTNMQLNYKCENNDKAHNRTRILLNIKKRRLNNKIIFPKIVAILSLMFIDSTNASEFTIFVKEGKMDVLLALTMAFIWSLRMVSYSVANKRQQVAIAEKWKIVERTSECVVLIVGLSAMLIALTVNGLYPVSITNVIATSVAIFISYAILPKVFRDNNEIRTIITSICKKPRYELANTAFVENSSKEGKFLEKNITLAIEYIEYTMPSKKTNNVIGKWRYIYYWNAYVYEREDDITLLLTRGKLDYRLFNMSGSKAQNILNGPDVYEQRIVAASLLVGMIPKNWVNQRFNIIMLKHCWNDLNTRYAVTSAPGLRYGIMVSAKLSENEPKWIDAMKIYLIEVIAIYLGEGKNHMKKVNYMINMMESIQNHIYTNCHNGFLIGDEETLINSIYHQIDTL